MLNKLKELRESGREEGFTLIELMIVVVIIGILAAIAIPIFSNQQKAALVAGVKSDVKNTTANIITALVKAPTANVIYSTSTSANIVIDSTISVPKTISNANTRITANGSWKGYWVMGTNTSVTSSVPGVSGTWTQADMDEATTTTVPNSTTRFSVFYNSTTGKTTTYAG